MKKEEGLFSNLRVKNLHKPLEYPCRCPNCPKILNNSLEHNRHSTKHIKQTK